MTYTIGEMARHMGITPTTLRFYDKEGLLPFVERSKTGVRLFGEKNFELLRIIGCLKKTGMSIKDIRKYIQMALAGRSTIDARIELLLKQREIVTAQIRELENTKKIIDLKCWVYKMEKETGQTEILRNLPDEEIPPKITRRAAQAPRRAGNKDYR